MDVEEPLEVDRLVDFLNDGGPTKVPDGKRGQLLEVDEEKTGPVSERLMLSFYSSTRRNGHLVLVTYVLCFEFKYLVFRSKKKQEKNLFSFTCFSGTYCWFWNI